jgi:tetraacyldisaccharide-1-P 4'-kinase
VQRTRLVDYIPGDVIRPSLAPLLAALLGRTVSRRLEVPAEIRVVAVGGATFGGSGKTPLAIACARELASAGGRVAFVGHAYRAHPRRPRVVRPHDPLDEVGDEALVAARALGTIPVVVAPSRQAAIDLAATLADVLVLDGVAQLARRRAALALLAVDAEVPWGRGPTIPPRGSLRAPLPLLLEACDAVVPIGERAAGRPGEAEGVAGEGVLGADERPAWPSSTSLMVVRERGPGARGLTWDTLRSSRVGLLTALARPERITRALAREGVVPAITVSARDHGSFSASSQRRVTQAVADGTVKLWLASEKCALHLDSDMLGIHVAVVSRELTLHPLLRERLREIARHLEPGMAAP